MKTMTIEIPDGKKAEWVNGVLTLVDEQPKDITERIKTFEDAKLWCTENGHFNLVREYDCIVTDTMILDEPTKDLIAYLKLRIIACALNEGWEPTFGDGEERYYMAAIDEKPDFPLLECSDGTFSYIESSKLTFKSEDLAKYAAIQFRDIYMDFCYKGKE